MAQIIQPSALSPVQAGIGSQAMVQDNTPTVEGLTQNLLNSADMAADMYVESKAKSLVTETIEEIDAARAVAERGTFRAGDPVPPELQVDQQQYDMLAGAVQAGTMSRENARLIASSRLRSRIAEQPLFADRMRKAASSVIGFNIESEGAQQYFASFATNAAIGQQQEGRIDKKKREMLNEAQRFHEVGLFDSQEAAYEMLVRADAAASMKQLAADKLEMGGMTSQQFGTEFNSANQVSAWGTLIGEVRSFEIAEGKPVDGVAFSRILDERKQQAVAEFNNGWSKSAPTGTPEYNRAIGNLTAQYDEMKDFVDTYGVDNLNKVAIERSVQAREIYGDQFFPTMKFISQNFGQQVASDVIKLSSLGASQRERMFLGNKPLRDAYELLGQDPAAFNKALGQAGVALVRGADLSKEDPVIIDAAATQLYNDGDKETQRAVVQSLFAGSLNWKGTSVAASKSPRVSDGEVVKIYKRQYEEGVVPAVKQFTDQITANPFLSWSINEAGMLNVEQVQSAPDVNRTSFGGLTTDPREAQNRLLQGKRAQQTADKLNQFAKGHKNGWSGVVGESLDQYTTRLTTLVGQGVIDSDNTKTTAVNTEIDDIVTLMENNDLDFAKRRYEKLRDYYPFDVTASWEDVLEELRGGN